MLRPIINEQHKVLKSLPLAATWVGKTGKREGESARQNFRHKIDWLKLTDLAEASLPQNNLNNLSSRLFKVNNSNAWAVSRVMNFYMPISFFLFQETINLGGMY